MEMEKELKINGYPAYQATAENIMAAYEAAETESEKAVIAKYYMESRLKYEVCRKDETADENFGRKFENFVNGRMSDTRKVADRMARSHRYLVQQMFTVLDVMEENGIDKQTDELDFRGGKIVYKVKEG